MIRDNMEKRGQGMTLGTIVVIVLAIVVLVFLIFGFSTGWGNLWDRITNLGGGDANVDTIKQACAVACNGNSVDAFCRQSRRVNYGNKDWHSGSCQTFITEKSRVNISIDDCGIVCDKGVPTLDGKVNGISVGVPKESCSASGGAWVIDDDCPASKEDLTNSVNEEGKGNDDKKCCK
jgi:hypothetical protein